MSSADNLCKQFGPRSGWTKHWAWSGFKLFDTLIVFLTDFLDNVNFEKKQQIAKKPAKLPSIQRVELFALLINPKSATYNLQQMTISNFEAFSKITNEA